MKKYLLASSVAALIAAGNVQAADVVQSYDPPVTAPEVAPAFSWGGGYVGLQVGGSWSKSSVEGKYDFIATAAGGSWGGGIPLPGPTRSGSLFKQNMNLNGFNGGFYAGYNFDTGSNFILGIETDFVGNSGDKVSEWLTGDFTDVGVPAGSTARLDRQVYLSQQWAGATRVRVGLAADRWMPYISAGVAYAGVKSGINYVAHHTGGTVAAVGTAYNKDTLTGWTAGIGSDYAVTDNMLLRLEYRYSDYGKKTHWDEDAIEDGVPKDIGRVGYTIKHKTHDLRVGIAYKF